MANLQKADIGEIYKHILNNAQLDEVGVTRKSARLGLVSFVEIDAHTQEAVLPVIRNMGDNNRDKARFMLDVCALNLLRKRDIVDGRQVVAVDVHLGTLMKTAFRTRYLVVLADFIKNFEQKVLLNIKSVPVNASSTRICDMLRYLIPILDDVSLQVSAENILAKDLTKISAKYFVLTVEELTKINHAERRGLILERLSRLPNHNKEIIVREMPRPAVRSEPVNQQDEAFYL